MTASSTPGERLAVHDPADGRVVDGAGALRVGEQDRRLDETPLTDRADADELADAVGGVRAGDDAVVPEVAAVREDRGDARAGGPAAVRQLGPAPRDGAVADAHAGHVGDRVQRSGRQPADGDAEVAQAAAPGAVTLPLRRGRVASPAPLIVLRTLRGLTGITPGCRRGEP